MAEGTSKRKSGTARRATTAGRASTARKVSAARHATKRTGSAGAKGVQAVRGIVSRGVQAPASLVTLSRDLIQEVMDDAVRRGRMTRSDANDLVVRLCQLGGIKQSPAKGRPSAKRKG